MLCGSRKLVQAETCTETTHTICNICKVWITIRRAQNLELIRKENLMIGPIELRTHALLSILIFIVKYFESIMYGHFVKQLKLCKSTRLPKHPNYAVWYSYSFVSENCISMLFPILIPLTLILAKTTEGNSNPTMQPHLNFVPLLLSFQMATRNKSKLLHELREHTKVSNIYVVIIFRIYYIEFVSIQLHGFLSTKYIKWQNIQTTKIP